MKAESVALVVALAAVVLLGVKLSQRNREITALTATIASSEAAMQLALADVREREAELAALRSRPAPASSSNLPRSEDLELENELDLWLGKVGRLSTYLESNPDKWIPQMEMLTANDWLDAANSTLVTDADFRSALGKLRGKARQKAAPQVCEALKRAVEANGGRAPDDPKALLPFLPEHLAPIVDQLSINPSGKVVGLGSAYAFFLIDKQVDIWDNTVFYSHETGAGLRFSGGGSAQSAVERAVTAFTAAHGSPPAFVSQIASYPDVGAIEAERLDALFRAVTTHP